MIRLQQFSHLIGGAASHHEHGRDEEDAVQDQVLASFLERGDVVKGGRGERQNTGKGQQRQSRRHSMIYGGVGGGATISGRKALQCINKLVSVLD